jgi:hypothetical protein
MSASRRVGAGEVRRGEPDLMTIGEARSSHRPVAEADPLISALVQRAEHRVVLDVAFNNAGYGHRS